MLIWSELEINVVVALNGMNAADAKTSDWGVLEMNEFGSGIEID
jgi:hypothetical protein